MDQVRKKRLDRLKGLVAVEYTPDPEGDAAYKHYCSEMEYFGWPIMSREEWDHFLSNTKPVQPSSTIKVRK